MRIEEPSGGCGMRWLVVTVVWCGVGAMVLDLGLLKYPNILGGIVSRTQYPAGEPCRDADGNARRHGEEWRSSAAICDHVLCHNGVLHNYTLHYGCRQFDVGENPDDQNCWGESNLTASFPHCCAQLRCDATNFTFPTYPPCYDRSPAYSCNTWKDLGGCSVSSPLYQNFTSIYCNITCGFCP